MLHKLDFQLSPLASPVAFVKYLLYVWCGSDHSKEFATLSKIACDFIGAFLEGMLVNISHY